MSGEAAFIYAVAILTVVTAVGVISSRNLVHSALWMVSNFGLTAVLYLALHAPFLAAVQVIIYAGAIMVLFLFVVMLLGGSSTSLREPLAAHRPLAVIGLTVLGSALAWAILQGDASGRPAAAVAPDFGSPANVGAAVFGRWVLPFELVSLLLLMAMVGAIVIAHFRRTDAGGDES